MTRNERRARTERYGTRCLRVHERILNPQPGEGCAGKTPWFFAKRKAMGCRCRRSRPGTPKIPASLTCSRGDGYHPCVQARIAGRRIVRAYRAAFSDEIDAIDEALVSERR
jgi:hypothetical protein